MQIQVSIEELKKRSLFIGMPTYGGMMNTMCAKSLIDLNSLFIKYGIDLKFSFLMNESLIQRARNYITDEFLNRTECTHMLFIDSDITFNPQDVIAMLALDLEVVGCPYAKKSINWGQIQKALKKNINIPVEEYEKLAGDIVFNPVANMTKFSVSEPVEVSEVGTGFCMYRREVFEKFQAAYPYYMYKPDHRGTEHFDGSREICSFFNVEIDPESRRLLSEDYNNCKQLRALGIKIWLLPWVELIHCGSYNFKGSLPSVANFIGEL